MLGPLSGRHSPDVATKLSTTDELNRISGKRRPRQLNPCPPQAARGGKVGIMYPRPKDSNAAVGVRDRATGKALKRADRQTNRPSIHYSTMLIQFSFDQPQYDNHGQSIQGLEIDQLMYCWLGTAVFWARLSCLSARQSSDLVDVSRCLADVHCNCSLRCHHLQTSLNVTSSFLGSVFQRINYSMKQRDTLFVSL